MRGTNVDTKVGKNWGDMEQRQGFGVQLHDLAETMP